MTMMSVEVKGVTERILNALVEQGYAKTKAEALRYALLHVGQEMQLIKSPRQQVKSMAGAFAGRISTKDIVEDEEHDV